MNNRNKPTRFYQLLEQNILEYGGIFNAHLHLDRAGILEDKYFPDTDMKYKNSSYISLHEKHYLINKIHSGPAYMAEDLQTRVNECIDAMIDCHTSRADTLVDVTADNVGISAISLMKDIAKKRKKDIDVRIGVYSPFGFLNSEPRRWEIFIEGVEYADFIAALPEADDTSEYPDHIGFMEHCRRMLELATLKNMILHIHTDQRNDPNETGTEQVIKAIKKYGAPKSTDDEPMVWVVHMISPSTYDEYRFERLVRDLKDLNIGVICCPSAALGMRQLRPLMTPTYNSIPRVLELIEAGIFVRLASDNICDICSPSTTANLFDEVFLLSAALRFYNIGILAKLAAGIRMDNNDIAIVSEHLIKNKQEIEKVLIERNKNIL